MTTTTSGIRQRNGVELPATGEWAIDPGHAEVAFIGRHFMLTKVRGRFTGVEGTVVVADDPQDSTVDVVIDMASVSSGDETRDDHLRSADLFDVAQHPAARFRSRSVTWNGMRGRVLGELTIRDITRPVVLDAEFVGHARDLGGEDRAVFSARGVLNREDWGITWNAVLETGGLLVSKDVTIEIEVETVRRRTGVEVEA
jgi:polyisoprenoid-binding protein YceI